MRLRYTTYTYPNSTRGKACKGGHVWPSGLTAKQFLDGKGPDLEKCPKCEGTRERVIG